MSDLATKVADWSTEAADAFLNQKVPLNTTIKKIAKRESLNREKVARVVEEANKTAFLQMFPKQADKSFSFDVADVDQIIGKPPAPEIQMAVITPPTCKHAEATKTASVSEALLTRTIEGSGVQQAVRYMEESTLAVELLREKAGMAEEKVMTAEVQFCKEAQQMVLQDSYTYEEIFNVCVGERPDHWKKIGMLLKVAAIHHYTPFKFPEDTVKALVARDEREKTAGAAIDSGEHEIVTTLSTLGMPVEVINGSHKLVVALDTLIDQSTEADKAKNGLRSADDSVKFLRKEVRNYLASHTTV